MHTIGFAAATSRLWRPEGAGMVQAYVQHCPRRREEASEWENGLVLLESGNDLGARTLGLLSTPTRSIGCCGTLHAAPAPLGAPHFGVGTCSLFSRPAATDTLGTRWQPGRLAMSGFTVASGPPAFAFKAPAAVEEPAAFLFGDDSDGTPGASRGLQSFLPCCCRRCHRRQLVLCSLQPQADVCLHVQLLLLMVVLHRQTCHRPPAAPPASHARSVALWLPPTV